MFPGHPCNYRLFRYPKFSLWVKLDPITYILESYHQSLSCNNFLDGQDRKFLRSPEAGGWNADEAAPQLHFPQTGRGS